MIRCEQRFSSEGLDALVDFPPDHRTKEDGQRACAGGIDALPMLHRIEMQTGVNKPSRPVTKGAL